MGLPAVSRGTVDCGYSLGHSRPDPTTFMQATAYSETVRISLSSLETGHLLEKVRAGSLTDAAHTVALRILKERGIDVQALPATPPDEGEPETWLKATDADRLEQSRRKRLMATGLLLPCLPLASLCAAGAPIIWMRTGYIIDTIAAAIFAVVATGLVMRYAKSWTFGWGIIPMTEKDSAWIQTLWRRFSSAGYGLASIFVLMYVLGPLL